MKEILIISIGRIKISWWKQAVNHYAKLLGKWHGVECKELKDSDPALPPEARIVQEKQRILANLSQKNLGVALSENGQTFTSPQFAAFIRKISEFEQRRITFVVGGPYGLHQDVLNACAHCISLSPMTWTHEMARVLLYEQLYRACCINNHIPYHH